MLGVIGPDTVESSYVLFELGAAWGHGILTFPLLVGGASYESVPSPLNELHSASLESEAIAQQLVENLEFSTSLESRTGVASRVAEEVRKLAKAARSTGKPEQASPKKPAKKKK